MLASYLTRSPALVFAILLGTLALAGCNGSGGGGGTSVPVSTTGTGSQLYVSGNTSSRLLIYNDANTVSGSTLPNRVVAGGLTTLSGARGIAVDMARDQIYVANFLNDSILVFHNARTVTGGDAPNRAITGAPLSRPSALFMDVVNNRLYVANTNGNSILIYDNASTLNGGVAPSRTLTGGMTTLSAPTGVYVDITRNLLYVANGSNQILVFNNAAITLGTINIAPLRTISISSNTAGIFVDVMEDRLYVANTGANSLFVFNSASTANSSSIPARTLSGGGSMLSQPRGVFVDLGTDRLYVANAGDNSILVFNNASTVNNPAAPNRTLGLTASAGPWGIYVDVTPILIGSTGDLDGYVRSDFFASASGSPATGDKESNFSLISVGWRQLYSFDIASIPTSATITSATLRLYQCDVQGSPYSLTSLGNVVVDHVNYGGTFDPSGSAYNGGVALNIGTLSTTASLGYSSLSITNQVENDLTASRVRSQYRTRFSVLDADSDGNDDFVQFTDAEDSLCAGATTNQPPQLAVTLRP